MNTTLRYGTPEEAGMDPKRIEHITDLARGWVEQGVTPSLVVLAARRGVIVLHEAYGVMGPEPDAGPLQKDTIFPLASLTKLLTAVVVMGLVEDGLIGLNRPVQWYLPEFVGEGKDAVMVHHLLTHTSGLTDEQVKAHVEEARGRILVPPMEATEHPRLHEALWLRYGAPLAQAPGREMFYCSWNYEFLGEIARRVSGRLFANVLHQRLLAPLGMHDSFLGLPEGVRGRLVQPIAYKEAAEALRFWGVPGTPLSSGGAVSTALDMAVFGQMLLNGGRYGEARILSRPAVEAMTRNQIPGIPGTAHGLPIREASWGLGPNVCGDKHCVGAAGWLRSSRMFGHDGWNGVELWVDPGFDLVTVYLSVASERGIPPGIQVRESFRWPLMQRRDLFLDALLGSIID